MRFILSLIVENKHGVLAKISQVITSRGYNINTITVGPSERKDTSRAILTLDCDEKTIQQVIKQLNKLIDVIKVFLIDETEKVERELVLLRVARSLRNDNPIKMVVDIFGGKVVHVTHKSFVIELSGHSGKIDAFIDNLASYGIQDLLRTGPLALPRYDM